MFQRAQKSEMLVLLKGRFILTGRVNPPSIPALRINQDDPALMRYTLHGPVLNVIAARPQRGTLLSHREASSVTTPRPRIISQKATSAHQRRSSEGTSNFFQGSCRSYSENRSKGPNRVNGSMHQVANASDEGRSIRPAPYSQRRIANRRTSHMSR